MRVILVIGARGQLGQDLVPILNDIGYIVPLDLPHFNMCDMQQMEFVLNKYKPTHIINCAAYTDVEKAEIEKGQAWLINTWAPQRLAYICKLRKIRFLHISTDYVIGRDNIGPGLKENALYNPLQVYGKSKASGEQAVLIENKNATIFRTSWLFGQHGKNFIKTVAEKILRGDQCNITYEQLGSPTWTVELSYAIKKWVKSNTKGIYHVSGRCKTSWVEVARYISNVLFTIGHRNLGLVVPVQDPGGYKAKRPRDSYLDCTKYEKKFGYLAPWQFGIETVLYQLFGGCK